MLSPGSWAGLGLGLGKLEGLGRSERSERDFKGSRAGWQHLGDHFSVVVGALGTETADESPAFSSLPASLWGTGVMASPTSAFPILMLPASLVAPPGCSQVGTAAVPSSCEHQPSIPLTSTNPSTKVKC